MTASGLPVSSSSVECRQSWVVALAALAILALGWGAPLVATVALKPIAADLGSARSIPALAGSAAFLGSGLGGVAMGWAAERVGPARIAAFGAVMTMAGMLLSAGGEAWQLLVGHAVMGLLGLSALFAPLITLVSRWFDRRRGTALALVSSGQYMAGILWPSVFGYTIEAFGWQRTMAWFGVAAGLAILPLTLLLRTPPIPAPETAAEAAAGRRGLVLGMRPNLAMGLISSAIFLCCIPMAMPPGHLVAFCSDLGIPAVRGAAMLSVMLAAAFISRQFWGWLADSIGGLRTVLAASSFQAVALAGFLATQDEVGLFTVSAAFGLGFSGIVPAYVVAIRELFPNHEAGWRVPVLLLMGQGSMAAGGWLAGAVYDATAAYMPAFALGVAFNVLNLGLLGFLLLRAPARTAVAPA